MREKITHYIRAGYAGLYLVSHEEQRVEAELKAIAATLKHGLYAWSATAGLIDTASGTSRGTQDPMEVLGVLAELPEDSIVLLRDYHLFFDDPNPLLLRQLKDQLRAGKTKGHTVAVLGCRLKLPPELEREFIVVDFILPGAEAPGEVLSGILKSTGKKPPSPESTAALIDAARGLTTTEAEDAFALSVVESGDLNPVVVAREKAQAVKKNGLLELIETSESLASIGGLDGNFTGDIRLLGASGAISVKSKPALLAGNMASASIVASAIASLTVARDFTDSVVLAGADLGANYAFGGGDDTYAAGALGAVKIGRNVSGVGSIIGAGFATADAHLKDANDAIIGGVASIIASITVTGTVGSESYFAAGLFKALPKIGGQVATPAGDGRFLVG